MKTNLILIMVAALVALPMCAAQAYFDGFGADTTANYDIFGNIVIAGDGVAKADGGLSHAAVKNSIMGGVLDDTLVQVEVFNDGGYESGLVLHLQDEDTYIVGLVSGATDMYFHQRDGGNWGPTFGNVAASWDGTPLNGEHFWMQATYNAATELVSMSIWDDAHIGNPISTSYTATSIFTSAGQAGFWTGGAGRGGRTFDNLLVSDVIPEPGSLAALASGLVGLCGLVRRRR